MVSASTVTGRGRTRACGDGACEPEGQAECGPRLVLSGNVKTRETVINYKKGKEAGRAGSDGAWAASCLGLLGPQVTSR